MFDYKKFWANDDLNNIVPLQHGEHPEGWDPAVALKDLIKDKGIRDVLDFGCGYGRLCRAFDTDSYLGVDLNPHAISAARKANPEYLFKEINIDSPFEKVDLVLAYTVFLHLDDDVLSDILIRLRKSCLKTLIIGEILGKEWRRPGLPPVFNRDLSDYQVLMSGCGFTFVGEHARPYKRYAQMPAFHDKNTDLSFLIFQ